MTILRGTYLEGQCRIDYETNRKGQILGEKENLRENSFSIIRRERKKCLIKNKQGNILSIPNLPNV